MSGAFWVLGGWVCVFIRRPREGGDPFSIEKGGHINRCPEVPAFARTTRYGEREMGQQQAVCLLAIQQIDHSLHHLVVIPRLPPDLSRAGGGTTTVRWRDDNLGRVDRTEYTATSTRRAVLYHPR